MKPSKAPVLILLDNPNSHLAIESPVLILLDDGLEVRPILVRERFRLLGSSADSGERKCRLLGSSADIGERKMQTP